MTGILFVLFDISRHPAPVWGEAGGIMRNGDRETERGREDRLSGDQEGSSLLVTGLFGSIC